MRFSFYATLALILSGWASAEIPRKGPITKYIGLYTDSPFTSKPPPAEAAEAVNPLSDYALGGISPIKGGYRLTLLNRKKPEDRTIIDSDDASSGFKILTVNRKPGDPLGTTVRLSKGGSTGIVAFDEKLLTLKTAAPTTTASQNQQNPTPGQQQPPIPGQTNPNPNPNPAQRQPRPRVIPPPAAGNSNQRQQPQILRPQR